MSSTAHVETHFDVVEKLLSNGINHLEVKQNYIFPPHERPQMAELSRSYSIPVIDLKDLEGPGRKSVVNEIKRACEKDGFFQIVNHGVPKSLMKSMMDVAKEFFEMSLEDGAYLCSEDMKQLVRLPTSFNITKDKFLNWVNFLTQPCHPLEEFIHAWPQKPAAYRIHGDEEHPALYRGYRFEEYMEAFRSQGLKSKSILDRFKIETGQ